MEPRVKRGYHRHGYEESFPFASSCLPYLIWPAAVTTYNAVERTQAASVRYINDPGPSPHPSVSVFELNLPTTRASVLQAFGVHLDA
jgi:hypothetical protein